MTIDELKAIIKDKPGAMMVMIEQTDNEFNLSLLNSAEVKTCDFVDGKLKAKEDCLVLSDY